MAQAQTAVQATRVEFGAWVEGTESRKDGKGMRKVWVSPAPEGTPVKLGVFSGTRFVFALHADTGEEQASAVMLLDMAQKALLGHMRQPAPAQAPAPARKAPTPPAAPKATPLADRQAIIDKARADRAALSVAPAPRVVAPTPSKPAKAPAQKALASDDMSWLDMLRA